MRNARLARHSTTTTTTKPSLSDLPPPPPKHRPILPKNPHQPQPTDNKPITAASFGHYTITPPPTPTQLHHASQFFTTGHPTHLFTASKFRTIPPSTLPEVAFLGRSNVGKSSLLNAVLQRSNTKLARTSRQPGKTREMVGFGVGSARVVGSRRGKTGREERKERKVDGQEADWERVLGGSGRAGLVVLDMPGYGMGSREEWGREIMKYLGGRSQWVSSTCAAPRDRGQLVLSTDERHRLRRTFLLVDSAHGLTSTDRLLLDLMHSQSLPHQIVLSKIDKKLFASCKARPSPEMLRSRLGQLPELAARITAAAVGGAGLKDRDAGKYLMRDVIACSAERAWPHGSQSRIGVDALRFAVLQACGLEADVEGWAREVKGVSLERGDEENRGRWGEEEVVPWEKILA
ncbi:MAG: hypothetical protein M1828_002248 [Chrysothrix sp. TS-e1954]|nr:MAG: hypothetical protein M1828_002248 [Chrysothrix sp. TS-e1954]